MRRVTALTGVTPRWPSPLRRRADAPSELVAFPLALYSGFFLERRYGLSRQTFATGCSITSKGRVGLALLSSAAPRSWYWTMARFPRGGGLVSGLFFAACSCRSCTSRRCCCCPLFFTFTPLDAAGFATSRAPGRAGRRARDGRVPSGRWVEDAEGECGAGGLRADAAHPHLRHACSTNIPTTRSRWCSRTSSPITCITTSGPAIAYETALTLAGFFAAHACWRGSVRALGLTALSDPAGLPLLLLAAGGVSLLLMPAALALSRATSGAPTLRARSHEQSAGVHLRDAAPGRAEPGRGAAVAPRAVALLQPSAAGGAA